MKRKKGQSTAEYAITVGLVVAVAAGVLQVALKGGIRQKNKEALNYLLDAGSTELGNLPNKSVLLFSEEYRTSTVDSGTYIDERIMEKSGLEKTRQRQDVKSTSVEIEKIDSAGTTGP